MLCLEPDGGVRFVSVPTSRYGVRAERLEQGLYFLPGSGELCNVRIYRNGVRQTEAEDYTRTGAMVSPRADYPWEPEDLIVFDCEVL